MTSQIAVIISDIHFSLNTLEIASQALRAALSKAEELKLPLIIAGDLQDTKAIIRGEVANRLIEILGLAKTSVLILAGNHDALNEKGSDNALQYLKYLPNVTVVDIVCSIDEFNFVPYQNSPEKFVAAIARHEGIVICHQGFKGALMGDYVQDKTSVDPSLFNKYRIISGHYHKHQTIGTVTYIGSPYTITFGEAGDGPKGFLILNSDGTFTREILKLRKHVILEAQIVSGDFDLPLHRVLSIKENDLVWLKVTGPMSELKKINKAEIGQTLLGHTNYKLDLIPTGNNDAIITPKTPQTDEQILDALIDKTAETEDQKTYLRKLWRDLL